jgi:hypothetical protein
MRKKTDSTGRKLGRAAAPLFARATAQHATHAAEPSSRRSSHHRPQPSEARGRSVEAIHGYDIEAVFNDEQFARRHEQEVGRILKLPLVSQYALRDGYSLVYGPIDGKDYLKLETLLYRKFGNAVRVRLVKRMYAGGPSLDERPHRPLARPRRR